MHSPRQSAGGLVPQKSPHHPVVRGAEWREGRPPGKGHVRQRPMPWSRARAMACTRCWKAYVRQANGNGRTGSPRSSITALTVRISGQPPWHGTTRLRRAWRGYRDSPTAQTWRRTSRPWQDGGPGERPGQRRCSGPRCQSPPDARALEACPRWQTKSSSGSPLGYSRASGQKSAWAFRMAADRGVVRTTRSMPCWAASSGHACTGYSTRPVRGFAPTCRTHGWCGVSRLGLGTSALSASASHG
jgi:hypothetical protein